jgi:hypothetical protein
VGFGGDVCGELLIHFLKLHNVLLAILHHLGHSLRALTQQNVFPHPVFRLEFTCPR